jgi:hypothetical protein
MLEEEAKYARDTKYWLRCLAVLPGSLLAGVIALFPLHLVLYVTLSNFIEPYPALPERLLTSLVFALVIVWLGSRIAPERKFETSIILFGLLVFLVGGSVFLIASHGTLLGQQFYFNDGAITPIMSIGGALVGLYIVRRQSATKG